MALANKFDIINYQQTRLRPKESFYLRTRLPAHKFFYNNYTQTAAGTLMIVSPHLAKDYSIKHVIIQPGYCQALIFTAKEQGAPGFICVNAYLYTGNLKRKDAKAWPDRRVSALRSFDGKLHQYSEHVRRAYQISLISKAVAPHRYLFLQGACNFHEKPARTAQTKRSALTSFSCTIGTCFWRNTDSRNFSNQPRPGTLFQPRTHPRTAVRGLIA
jgi:hypothetical protein